MEPECPYCGLVDKACCRSADEAEDCPHAPVEGKGPVIRTGPLAGLHRRRYGAILADPPWHFAVRSEAGEGRSASQHYRVQSLDDIKAMPVRQLAADHCVLFLWVIDPMLREAFDVLDAWGFTYKTRAFCWAKRNSVGPGFFTGMGFWTRANPEDCWLAVRGSPKRLNGDVRRLLLARRREHSRKPDAIYERIERLVEGPYCELFSRSQRAGWDAMGDEREKFGAVDHDLI